MEAQHKRWFLALLLCAAVAVLWQMWFAKPPTRPGPTSEPEAVQGTQPGTGTPLQEIPQGTGLEQVELPLEGTGEPVAVVLEPAGAPFEILEPQRLQGNGFVAQLSNAGAVLVDHRILEPEQYVPREGFTGIFPSGTENHQALGIQVDGLADLAESTPYRFVEQESVAAPGSSPEAPIYQRLVYRWSNGQIQVDKVFEAAMDTPYLVDMDLVFTNLGAQEQTVRGVEVLLWADDAQSAKRGILNPIPNTRQVVCYVNDSVEKESRDDIEGQRFSGPAQWAGVQDRYFLAAAAIPDGSSAAGCRFERRDNFVASALLLAGFTLAPGEQHVIELLAYNGPKDMDALKAVGAQLTRSVDFGVFGFLARPMKWVLTGFYKLIPNWGVAIILLTILVKILLFPWTQKSFKSMERMKAIQPRMAELKEKYANDKTKLTEETMKLYREHNVSPFGCLPMLLQMPIYIALYRMIYSSVELYKAGFALWIKDLSEPDPTYVLPILMAATMFGQQLLTPTTTDNPQMKWMMRLMPLIFGFFMLVLPSGLVLYIFVSSLLGMIQQFAIRRQFAKPAPAPAGPAPGRSETRPERRRRERRQAR